jgi:hypothetical protein
MRQNRERYGDGAYLADFSRYGVVADELKARFPRTKIIRIVGFDARFAVVAGVAEGLQVGEVEPRTALVDWHDVVNHLRKGCDASSGALLTQG